MFSACISVQLASIIIQQIRNHLTVNFMTIRNFTISMLLTVVSMGAWGQKAFFERGKAVYVSGEPKEIVQDIKRNLQQWGYWQVVSTRGSADFEMIVRAHGSTGITWTSWGGKSIEVRVELHAGKDEWHSPGYKASPNGSNGFNSQQAAIRKLMKGLKKQAGQPAAP